MTRTFATLLIAALTMTACDSVDSLSEIGGPEPPMAPSAGDDAAIVALETDPSGAPVIQSQSAGKMTVCHYDAETDAFAPISVSVRAYEAHMSHGDGVPGGEVPGAPGSIFDETCRPTADDQPLVCEIAAGTDASGKNTLTVTGYLRDPAPRGSAGYIKTNALVVDVTTDQGWIKDGANQILGAWFRFTQIDPAQESVVTFRIWPNIPADPPEGYACGPFSFGTP